MKRTDFLILCGQEGKYGMPIYRTAMMDEDGRYWVRWQGKVIEVTDDIKSHKYLNKKLGW